MLNLQLKPLVEKLNDTCRTALESAAGLCLSRTNYNVEIEHWLSKLLEENGTDMHAVFQQYGVDPSRVATDLTRAMDKLKTGNSRAPSLSPNVVNLIQQAWLIASVEIGSGLVRSGHLIAALLADDMLRLTATSSSREFERISADSLRNDLAMITKNSREDLLTPETSSAASPPASSNGAPAANSSTPALDQYTIDLTQQARDGKIDPVLGRDNEIRQLIDILTRRRQNNPILTGEAGVGKTAVVEGFALRIAEGDVPAALENVSLRSLDIGLLQAGAGVKGEFENRLKKVIEEVRRSPTPIILFIDEAHTLIGAGGQQGQGDAANLLKPALARGELRTIAATTWMEYKKYFEKDAAFTRRFQVVKVEEPSEEAAVAMLRGLVDILHKHHHVRILDEAVVDAVKLSARYISGRQLPDKAISLLDTTCARIGISRAATPPAIEDCRRRIDQQTLIVETLQREAATGIDHNEQIAAVETQLANTKSELAQLEERWQKEKELVEEVEDVLTQLTGDDANSSRHAPCAVTDSSRHTPCAVTDSSRHAPCAVTDAGTTATSRTAQGTVPATFNCESASEDELRSQLTDLRTRLRTLQGENPLVNAIVDSQAVAETVSAWTGIPLGRMVADEIKTVTHLSDEMQKSIIGQDHALAQIAQRIQTSRAGLSDPRTPVGVFLLAGTSGVGKTETAVTLANLIYGGEQNMTTINMSEFKEEHKVSLLMGSPPGYVGYGEGGVLTEAVRRKPYSVVLLDEMEKAHPGVQDIFYQVFDKGTMKDGEGRDIDFRNTIVIMTSNAGTDLVMRLCSDPNNLPDVETLQKALFDELLKTFKPAFLGRLNVVPYFPLGDDVLRKIVELKLGKIARRVEENHHAAFNYSPELVEAVAARCTEVDTGARNVDHILSQTLLPEMSAEFLSHMGAGLAIRGVHVTVGEDGQFAFQIETDADEDAEEVIEASMSDASFAAHLPEPALNGS